VSMGVPPPTVRMRSGFAARTASAAAMMLGQGVCAMQLSNFPANLLPSAAVIAEMAFVLVDSVLEQTTNTLCAPMRSASSAAASAAGRPKITRSRGR